MGKSDAPLQVSVGGHLPRGAALVLFGRRAADPEPAVVLLIGLGDAVL